MGRSIFETDHQVSPGDVETLSPMVRVVTAPNAAPMTFTGTRTYIYGRGQVAVIDPGPDDPAHLKALLRAVQGETVSHILVTHSHLDHSPLARALSDVTGAPIYAYGPHGAGRSALMQDLAVRGGLGGGEGSDLSFAPDIELADGEVISGDGWSLRAFHTPGHISNHLSFVSQELVFSGDHVMGWATTMVSPPDGDLTQFYASLDKIAPFGNRVFYPGHGKPVSKPAPLINHIRDHRKLREAQIIDALKAGPATPMDLTARIYHDVDKRLWKPASRNVLAHLIDLVARDLGTAPDGISDTAEFALA